MASITAVVSTKVRSVRVYRQCFGPWRGVAFLVFAHLAPTRFRNRPMKAPDPGSRRGLLLRLGTDDIEVFKSIFFDEEYEWHFVDPPGVVVDAGAYTGLSAAWFARRYPDAKIIAIEPSPTNFDLLKRNTADLPNVHIRRAALWCESGSLVVSDAGPSTSTSGYQVRQSEGDGSHMGTGHTQGKVGALTVEDVIREYSIDRIGLLKVDIEGSEVEVFSNSSAWIGTADAICVELHDRFRPGCSRAFYEAVSELPIEARRGENVLVVRNEDQMARATD